MMILSQYHIFELDTFNIYSVDGRGETQKRLIIKIKSDEEGCKAARNKSANKDRLIDKE